MLFELEQSVLAHRNQRGKAITLDFSGVVFIDDAGVKLLRKMKNKNLKIINCSVFIKTVIGDLAEEDV
jgi:anti-anti-sigma regulatory factor